jgi:hypothetical protein
MTGKTVGYVELEWTCPNCGNKNLGMKKSCGTCGAPQPANVQFELDQKRDLLNNAQKISAAEKGADIYCAYCNTRNVADAQTCIQCGGDLKEGVKRESGKVLNSTPVAAGVEIKCPNCASLNPTGSITCKACGALLSATNLLAPTVTQAAGAKPAAFRSWMALPVIAILALCCLVFGFLFFRTTALTGTVQDTQWQRVVAIEAQREVTKEAWRDQVPSGAEPLACHQEYRRRQDNPAPGAKEVCSTEYVDQGNGSAKVVETCYYEIYDDYCKYKALEWQKVEQSVAQGTDLQPHWPQVNLKNGQREGERAETYIVDFETKDGVKQFTTSNAALYARLQPGTQWTLSVNTLGIVVDVSP